MSKRYFKNVLLGLDLFLSTVTGGLPGTTLSGRTGSNILKDNLRGRIFGPTIDYLMYAVGAYPTPRGHCVNALEGDKIRSRAVIADDA